MASVVAKLVQGCLREVDMFGGGISEAVAAEDVVAEDGVAEETVELFLGALVRIKLMEGRMRI